MGRLYARKDEEGKGEEGRRNGRKDEEWRGRG